MCSIQTNAFRQSDVDTYTAGLNYRMALIYRVSIVDIVTKLIYYIEDRLKQYTV